MLQFPTDFIKFFVSIYEGLQSHNSSHLHSRHSGDSHVIVAPHRSSDLIKTLRYDYLLNNYIQLRLPTMNTTAYYNIYSRLHCPGDVYIVGVKGSMWYDAT